MKPVQLVIEGAGSVVAQYYLPALERLCQEGCHFGLTFVDDSRFWRDDPDLVARMQLLRARMGRIGATYLDKSEPADFMQWSGLDPDALVIATPDRTHVEVALEWVRRSVPPRAIYIEKPLDVSVSRARDLLGVIGPENDVVRAFDHYRARLLPAHAEFDMLAGFLKSGIAKFTFYFLEDRSGADPLFAAERGKHQGPIENENRQVALREGLLLDAMPHVIAVLAHFGAVSSMELKGLRAGKYTGVGGVPDEAASIDGETFAEVRFLFRSHLGNRAEGVAYIGKGIKGSQRLGRDYDHNTKLLVIEGVNGRKATFDFRKSGSGNPSKSIWTESSKEFHRFDLHSDPYYVFLRSITSSTDFDERIALPVEVGKRTLEVIEDMRYPVVELLRKGHQLPAYPCGIFGMRDSLYLEDVVSLLPPMYGR